MGGGAGDSYRARVRWAWAKFREQAAILTNWGASLKVKGKMTCARLMCKEYCVWK